MVSTPPEWPPLSLTFPFLNHRAKSKISEFWKNEKNCLRHHHFTHAYQKTKIRWGMVSEIHSETHKNFLSFWAIFCTLTSLTTLEIKIKKKKKKKRYLEMSSFYFCVPKFTIIWCMLPEIWSATDIIFCHFGSFFAFLPLYWPQKFGKNFKKHLDILSFDTFVHK